MQRGDFMEILMSILVCFFALYGVFQLFYNISLYLSSNTKIKTGHIHRLVIIDDKCEDVEAYVRFAGESIKDGELIILLNCSNRAEISNLIYTLENSFNYVKVMTHEEYYNYINEII